MIIYCYIHCVSFPFNSCKLYVTNSEVYKLKLARYNNIVKMLKAYDDFS